MLGPTPIQPLTKMMSWSLCSGGDDNTFGAPFVSITFHRDVGTEQYDKVAGAPEGHPTPPNLYDRAG